VFVCGTADGIIKVSGRRHNCDDLKATILAVDPIKFVYRGRLVSYNIIYKSLELLHLYVHNWNGNCCHLSLKFIDAPDCIFIVFNFNLTWPQQCSFLCTFAILKFLFQC